MKILSLIAEKSADFNKIYKHPFNQQLATGELSSRIFRNFLAQDSLYLLDYAKALNLFAQRLPNEAYAQRFRYFANDTVALEQEIQSNYLKKLATCTFFCENSVEITKLPVIAEYTEHLLYVAEHGPLEVAAASFIPCFWIYKELGEQMDLTNCEPNHPYYGWISTYSDEAFRASTMEMISIADFLINAELLKGDSQQKEEKITECFLKSVEMEYRFFDEIIRSDQLTCSELTAGKDVVVGSLEFSVRHI